MHTRWMKLQPLNIGPTLARLTLTFGLLVWGSFTADEVHAAAPNSFEVAITIDDLPWASIGQGPLPDDVPGATDQLLAHLTTRAVLATGYVNCDRAGPGAPVLKKWLAAKMTLGNHQAAHDNINKVKESVYIAGIRRCHSMLTELMGTPAHTYRYPFLYYGQGAEKRDRIHRLLTTEFSYRIARVTVDNHEWLLARYYGEALKKGDTKRSAEIGNDYIQHVRAAMANARTLATQNIGRAVSHILLLHANALARDHLGRLLDALAQDGAVFVSVEKALADPVYGMSNRFEGFGGINWLYRVTPETPVTSWEDASMAEIQARFGLE
jgi:peptidoglycan/xylan/chitin deacetylase (PgdA/CDA1 family)